MKRNRLVFVVVFAGFIASATIANGQTPPPSPMNAVNQTNCAAALTNPALTVSVASGETVDWYDMPAGGNLLAVSTTSFAPTITVVGSYTFFAEARDLGTGLVSANRTPTTLTLADCAKFLTIHLDKTNVILQWFGKPVLESTAVLTNPAVGLSWTAVATGTRGMTNYWTNAATAQEAYFRLRLNPPPPPTNAVNQTNCAFSLPNPALSVSVAAGATADWYAAPVGENPLLVGSLSFVASNTTPGTYTYYAAARDLLTGFVSTSRTAVLLHLNAHPTATLASLHQISCNDGSAFVIQAVLTGVSPWTVTWWDGVVSDVIASPAKRTVYPTNILANSPTNYFFYVTNLVDADCLANRIGDLLGTNTVTINPRPTATLISGDTITCNIGAAYTLTNILTGIGPWTVRWNDGTAQTSSSVGPGPVTLTRTVFATNTFLNTPSNQVFFVTAVSNATSCAANQPGDIKGTNIVTVNPRPTATLISGDTITCNIGAVYTLTNILTGIGPWHVTWSDGFVQTVFASLATRTVFPTNTFLNTPSNNVFFVIAVSDVTGCVGNQPGDINGTNIVTVNPRPTATLVSANATICNIGAAYTLTNILTGIGPWTVRWNDGTAHTSSSMGPGPVILTRTVFPTNTFLNTPSNNVFFVTAVSNVTGCVGNQLGDIKGTNVVTVNPRPTATVSGSATICNGSSTMIQAALTGIPPWNVNWSDGATQIIVASPALRVVGPAMTTNFTVTNLFDAQCTATAGDRIGNAMVTVVNCP